jgi:hypothetical protein
VIWKWSALAVDHPGDSQCGEQKSRTFGPRSKWVGKTYKNIDKHKRNDLGRKVHEKAMKRTIIVIWINENYQIIAFVIIDCSYLCF